MRLLSTNSREVKLAIFQHLLDAFESEKEVNTPAEKIQALKETELRSMGWMLEQGYTSHRMHQDYLQGLGISIEYMNHSILERVASINNIAVSEIPDALQDKILANWFPMLSVKLEQLYALLDMSKSSLLAELTI